MSYAKRALLLTIVIGAILFFYLRSVRNDREKDIELFLRNPEVGDIYKIRYLDQDGNRTVRYYKLTQMHEDYNSFYPGRLSAWNLSDVILDDYDNTITKDFSPADIRLMREGKLTKFGMHEARLIEIQRKAGRVPENSI